MMDNRKFKALLVIVLVAVFGWLVALQPLQADPTDEATLGGIDSSGNYRWRVTLDGNLIPGTDGANDLGSASNEIDNIYAEDVDVSGTIQFQTNIFASGHNSGVTTVASEVSPLTSAHLAFGLVQLEAGSPGNHTIPDGVQGQTVTFVLLADPSYSIEDNGATTITNTGWTKILFDTAYDSITLLWVDDTYGWIIVANDGCTITR